MTLPRMAAMAEVVWSPKSSRDWNDFASRIEMQFQRYEAARYNAARSAYLASIKSVVDTAARTISVAMSAEMPTATIRFTLDDSSPTSQSMQYTQPLSIDKTTTIRAATFVGDAPASKVSEQDIFLHKAIFKSVALKNLSERYDGGGLLPLTNGMRGTKSFNDGNWVGFHQVDMEATVDLEKVVPLNRTRISFLQNTASWIFFPPEVTVEISEDGNKFVLLDRQKIAAATQHEEPSIKEIVSEIGTGARFIRVRATNVGLCPDWHIAKGDKAWLFVDEIVVE